MPTAGVSHDITIEDSAGTNKRGYMLYRGSVGRRPYGLSDARSIQPRVASASSALKASTNLGEFTLGLKNFWTQSDFRGGMGGTLARLSPDQVAAALFVDLDNMGRYELARRTIVTTENTAPDNTYSTGFAVVGTEVWAFMGRDVYSWDYTAKSWVLGTEPVAAANTYRNGVEYAGKTYVPSWKDADDTPVRYIFKADADANWTRIDPAVSDTNTNSAKYFAVADGKLWGGYWLTDKHHVRSTTDPTASANWSSAVSVGTAESEITGMVADGDTLLVCKTNGVWALYPDGSTRNLIPEYETMRHPDHFRNPLAWNGHILLPLGWPGILDLWEGTLYNISFQNTLAAFPDTHGNIIATAADGDSVYLLQKITTSNGLILLKGEWYGFRDGIPTWRWVMVGTYTLGGGTNLYTTNLLAEGIPSGTNIHRRTWMGYGRVALGTQTGRPLFFPRDQDVEDAFINTNSDALVSTTTFDGNTPNITKLFLSVDLKTLNLASDINLVVQYLLDKQADFTTGWVTLGTLTADNGSLNFAAGVTGKTIKLRFQFATVTGVTTDSGKLSEFTLAYYVRPERLEKTTLRFYIADQMRLLNGARGGLAKNDLSRLRTWAGQGAEVKLTDAEGTAQTMVFIPGSLRVQELGKEPGRRAEYVVEAELQEV